MHENGGVLVESISCHVDVFVVVENNIQTVDIMGLMFCVKLGEPARCCTSCP